MRAHEAVNQYFTQAAALIDLDAEKAFADEHQVSLRHAAYAIGIRRVADAVKLRGYV